MAATSTTSLSYQWQRLPSGSSTWANVTGASYSGGTTGTLTASNQSLGNNSDQFRCIVTNAAGATTSNAAMLTVTPPGFAKFSAGRYHSLRLSISAQLSRDRHRTPMRQLGTGNTTTINAAQPLTLPAQTVMDLAAGALTTASS